LSPGGRAPLPRVLWPLLYGNFVIGAGVMVVAATLSDISADFSVTPASAGQLITAGGVVMCLGAPLLAALAAGWDRRALLALALAWYAALHAACALAPGLGSLLPLRAAGMVSAAVFTPQAAACVGLLVPAHHRGRAIAFIFLGWSLASVVGMPLGAYIGGLFGWRAAFVMVAAFSAIGAAWVWRAMPAGVRPPAMSRQAWAQVLQSRPLLLCIVVTLLYSVGQFVVFAYFAPYFRQVLGADPVALSLLLMWFGAFGLAGNVVASRHMDRIGADRAVAISLAAMAASLLAWPLGTSLALAALVMVPWALGCFAANSAQQARLLALGPSVAAGSIALNTSAIYAGQAIGAGGGGWLLERFGYPSLHWAGFAGLAAALAASVGVGRLRRAA